MSTLEIHPLYAITKRWKKNVKRAHSKSRSCYRQSDRLRKSKRISQSLRRAIETQILDKFYECFEVYPPDEPKAADIFQSAYLNKLCRRSYTFLAAGADFYSNAQNLQIRDVNQAIKLLQESLIRDGTRSPERYFQLAQLLASDPAQTTHAIDLYLSGICLLESKLPLCRRKRHEISRNIAGAYCSIAELLLSSDNIDEAEKEKIPKFLKKASHFCAAEFDVLATQSMYFASKTNISKGAEYAKKALKQLKRIDKENQNSLSLRALFTSSYENNPPYEIDWSSRLNFASTLVNLNMFEEADELLNHLLQEDENNVEAVYVKALNFLAQQPQESTENSEDIESLLDHAIQVLDLNLDRENTTRLTETKRFCQMWKEKLSSILEIIRRNSHTRLQE